MDRRIQKSKYSQNVDAYLARTGYTTKYKERKKLFNTKK